MLTLVDEAPHEEYDSATGTLVSKAIDIDAFPGTPTGAAYWTSSTSPMNPARAYVVDFSDGTPSTYPLATGLYVRCVHD